MKQLILPIFLIVLQPVCIQAQGDRFVCDESCDPGSGGVAKFNVVSPVGFSTVEPIEMAPRLTTLEGKTIAIVGEDFMYNITHPELGRLIMEHYPSAKIIMNAKGYQPLSDYQLESFGTTGITSAENSQPVYRKRPNSSIYNVGGQRLGRFHIFVLGICMGDLIVGYNLA